MLIIPSLLVLLATLLLSTGLLGPTSYVILVAMAIVLGIALRVERRVKKIDLLKGRLVLRKAQEEFIAHQDEEENDRPILESIEDDAELFKAMLDELQQLVDAAKETSQELEEEDAKRALDAVTVQVEADLTQLQLTGKPDRTLLKNAVSSSTGLAALQFRGHAPSVVIGTPTHNVFEPPSAVRENRRSLEDDP